MHRLEVGFGMAATVRFGAQPRNATQGRARPVNHPAVPGYKPRGMLAFTRAGLSCGMGRARPRNLSPRPVSLRRLLVLAAVFAFAAPPLQAQVDVIRGRVTGPDSLPIENVAVTATSIGGNVSRSARTDRSGRFTITFPGGEGDYMVSFTHIGYAPRRFEVKRTADQEILVADARLTPIAGVLDTVNVRAARERVPRGEIQPDIGGTEQAIAASSVPIDQLGDLAAMAASLPGVQFVPGQDGGPDGFSVLGLGADQNNSTLNGMNFGGSNLPRDAAVRSGLATSPYDVSRGGFSGAQFSLNTRPGSNFRIRGASLNLDAPQLQWTDRAAQALGQEFGNVSLGGVASGPISPDRAFYNVSYQLGRRSSEFQSLLNTSDLGLQAAGVAPDSVTRLLGILAQERVPTTAGSVGNHRLSDQGSVLGSLDYTPPGSTSGQAFNLTFTGGWGRTDPAGGGPIDLPSFGGTRTNWRGALQGRHSAYLFGILSETSVGANASQSHGDPYVSMPAGRVRVSSDFADGVSGVQMLSFGGNPMIDATQRTTGAAFMNQLSWFSGNNTHRLKLTSELRHEGIEQEQAANRLGTFTFNSLADLEAGTPSSFTRQLSTRRRDSDLLVGGLSLGDAWRVKPDFQVQYGVRVDGNRFLDVPAHNEAVSESFGVRNDFVPNRLYLSPRAGFSWTYGTASEITSFQGAMRNPRAVVRGGIGMFQNMPGANLVGMALDQTGLPGGAQQINCIGAAAPVPDWQDYGLDPTAIPDRCADGTAGTVFADATPGVTLFSRDFESPKSLRSNLQWSGPVLGNRFATTVDATWSLNRAQQGTVDLNFSPVERFTLPDEDGRPVFVAPSSIVPATGAVSARDSRLFDDFGRVLEMRSDLRSVSRQLSLRLSPTQFSTSFSWNLSYVLSDVRERTRGFSSTVSNPLNVEWARSSFDSRHQIQYNLGYNFFDAVRVNWFGSFRSGTPFTPMIASDVNGDGYSNDRAFIFDPTTAPDAGLAESMQSLLASGSRAARECLADQRGRLASRNSCEGPWTSTSTLGISLNPVKFRMPQRASITFQLSNPLGAADLMFNGSRNLRGWGQQATPDPALLYVRGFDPATQRYRYEVNQRFGSTSPSGSAFRTPVTLTAMFRFDLGPMRERQLLTSQLDRGRRSPGTKTPEPLLRAMYSSGGILNPIATILRQQDTLGLTPVQADSIATLNRWYTIRLDSIWSPVVAYFGSLPDKYDQGAAYSRYLAARRASIDLLADLSPDVKGLLTPEQRRKLPQMVASHLEPRYLASIRSGTASFTSGMGGPMGGGMMMMPGGAAISGAGGATSVTIIRQP